MSKRLGELELADINVDSLGFKAGYQLLSVLNSIDLAIEDKESVTYQNTKLFKQALSNHLHKLSDALKNIPENQTFSIAPSFEGVLKDWDSL